MHFIWRARHLDHQPIHRNKALKGYPSEWNPLEDKFSRVVLCIVSSSSPMAMACSKKRKCARRFLLSRHKRAFCG